MKEYYGNILDLIGSVDALCITTNMFVKTNGRAVMGRAIAKAINDIVPEVDLLLGEQITAGNKVCIITNANGTDIIAFPVKGRGLKLESEYDLDNIVKHMKDKFKVGDYVPGWACKAEPRIIKDSCQELVYLTDNKEYKEIYLPRPGCGAGELEYNSIKSVERRYIDEIKNNNNSSDNSCFLFDRLRDS